MNALTGVLVYLVIWWLVFFMILPIGVRSHREAGEEIVPGSHESAPVRPMLWRKAGATTVLAGLLWGVFYLISTNGWISLK
ncbi:MAG: DUF1467 family protein [Rhodothalassiaceae bacterium]